MSGEQELLEKARAKRHMVLGAGYVDGQLADAEIDELLFQVAAYAGAPAGVSAKRALAAVRAAEQSAEE